MSRIHVIGGGLAGLSAAITASAAGRPVTLYEATAAAGGRCRSYFDTELGIRLDNGNHMLLSGNKAAMAYIKAIGSENQFNIPKRPIFPFLDLKTGREWTLRPNRGPIPWWLLFSDRRVPKTTLGEHLAIRKLGRDWDDTVVTETMRHTSLYWLLLEPLSVAALNTRPHEGLACLFGAVLRETLMKGGSACRPVLAAEGLSEALVDPAIETLTENGADVLFNRRVTGLVTAGGRVVRLETNEDPVDIAEDEAIVLAVPPWIASELMPSLTVPDAFESILNIHYKIEAEAPGDIDEAGFVGLVNGTAEWIFVKSDHVSVTVSAANKLIERSAADLAETVWRNVVKALDLDGEQMVMPEFRVIKERRATFVANVIQEERRPGTQTDLANVMLAGDWTDTRLPATLEGAIRSGVKAANLAMNPPKPVKRQRKRKLEADAR